MMGFGFLWIVVLVVVAVVFVKMLFPTGSGAAASHDASKDRAFEIAACRYARGEIGKEEFEDLKRELA